MIESARMKAGMPSDKAGNVLRCYTNQSEAVNNKLTRQKEAITGKAKNKSDLKKIEFVRDVWEEVDNQQQSELKLAMFGMSEEYELSDEASYLEVNPEDWFEWPEEKRAEYARKFNELNMEDVSKKKTIVMNKKFDKADATREWREFPEEIKALYSLQDISQVIVETVIKEAEKLLNSPNSIQKMPSLGTTHAQSKYLVASKDCKKQMYECTVHRDHVACTCQCYKYNGLCKHSLCVAETANILKEHVQFVNKSSRRPKPSRSNLVEPQKNAAGKKGNSHGNPWRPRRANSNDSNNGPQVGSTHPYSAIHHNNRPFVVSFLMQQPKAIECKQCRTEFPRRKTVIPFDIVLSHEEKWMYPDPKKQGEKLPSARFTTKFYCVKRSCIFSRFPYFDSSYLEIPAEVYPGLKDAHRNLLKSELDYNET